MAEPEPESAMPEDPVTNLGGMATFHHELFRSYMEAGFSEGQALVLVAAWIAKP